MAERKLDELLNGGTEKAEVIKKKKYGKSDGEMKRRSTQKIW